MTSLRASSLLVFVGAGASRSAPSCLPTFDAIRDELLRQVGLDDYVAEHVDGVWSLPEIVVQGLAPEPFLQALLTSRTDVTEWLTGVLTASSPNAVHRAVAQLATAGARVWTVNFDHLIEASDSRITVDAWPDHPASATLLKPHGNLGGRLIFTPRDVLSDLRDDWAERLVVDVANSELIIFVGYSGRDLDFRPLWDRLTYNRPVLWFDYPSHEERARKQTLLTRCHTQGLLTLEDSHPNPSGSPNPAWDFVEWCETQGLVSVPEHERLQLLEMVPPRPYPQLKGDLRLARASILALLSDYSRAQTEHGAGVLRGPHRWDHLRAILNLSLSHGTTVPIALSHMSVLLPPLPRVIPLKARIRRKRLTAAANQGQHERVLTLTSNSRRGDVSTVLIHRAAALRCTGNLDEAVLLAEQALTRAREEGHEVRTANAAFELTMALMWAGRIAEARSRFDSDLQPFASIASNRWVAWSNFMDGCIRIHEGNATGLLATLDSAAVRFASDGLFDGLVSTRLVRLTAHRLVHDDAAYEAAWDELQDALATAKRHDTYYTRDHSLMREAMALERATYLLHHLHLPSQATQLYQTAAMSRYPVHQALGFLGLAAAAGTAAEQTRHAARSYEIADRIGAQLVRSHASQLRATGTLGETFYP